MFLVCGPLGRWSQQSLKLAAGKVWLARAIMLTGIYSGMALLRLPFSIIRYHHALSYGLRHDTLAVFLLDWSKGFLIVWLLVLIVGLTILGLFSRFPRWWTVFATTVTGTLAVTYTISAPLIIDPLYYEFRPLEDPLLKQRVMALSTCAGLDINEILVADASRRSPSLNAYVTGIGDTERIVLFDTLIQKLTPDEIAIVLAHEIAHWSASHIIKGLFMGIFGLFVALLMLDRLLKFFVRQRINGISSRHDPALVIPGYAFYVVMMFVILVPSNVISRQMETEADQKALEITQDPDTFIETKIRIASSNLSNVLPESWVEFALFTHPSIARRIMMAEKLKDNPGPHQSGCGNH